MTPYLLMPGQEFSRMSLNRGDYPAFKRDAIFKTPDSFHVGLITPSADVLDLIPPNSSIVFGWAEFGVGADGELELLDHAVAYGAEGIIVGTTTAIVPEPSTGLLALFGGLLTLRRTRR